jgi:hypothetical protein
MMECGDLSPLLTALANAGLVTPVPYYREIITETKSKKLIVRVTV